MEFELERECFFVVSIALAKKTSLNAISSNKMLVKFVFIYKGNIKPRKWISEFLLESDFTLNATC